MDQHRPDRGRLGINIEADVHIGIDVVMGEKDEYGPFRFFFWGELGYKAYRILLFTKYR